jgi:hypothetical protein
MSCRRKQVYCNKRRSCTKFRARARRNCRAVCVEGGEDYRCGFHGEARAIYMAMVRGEHHATTIE